MKGEGRYCSSNPTSWDCVISYMVNKTVAVESKLLHNAQRQYVKYERLTVSIHHAEQRSASYRFMPCSRL